MLEEIPVKGGTAGLSKDRVIGTKAIHARQPDDGANIRVLPDPIGTQSGERLQPVLPIT